MSTTRDATVHDLGAALLAHANLADPWVAFRLARYVLAAHALSGLVLDLGCEYGVGARLLARKTTPVVAADLDAQRLTVARSLLAGSGAVVVRADGRRLPFGTGVLDGICAFNVLSLVGDPDALLAECWRVLRLGGLVAISDVQCGGDAQPDPALLHLGNEATWCVVGMHLADGRVRFTTTAARDLWQVAFGSADPSRVDEVCRVVDGVTFQLADEIITRERCQPTVVPGSVGYRQHV